MPPAVVQFIVESELFFLTKSDFIAISQVFGVRWPGSALACPRAALTKAGESGAWPPHSKEVNGNFILRGLVDVEPPDSLVARK
jgi:hypothetical protein